MPPLSAAAPPSVNAVADGGEFQGWGVPVVEVADRLDVVVGVQQHGRGLRRAFGLLVALAGLARGWKAHPPRSNVRPRRRP